MLLKEIINLVIQKLQLLLPILCNRNVVNVKTSHMSAVGVTLQICLACLYLGVSSVGCNIRKTPAIIMNSIYLPLCSLSKLQTAD